jgi:hypothetical protein
MLTAHIVDNVGHISGKLIHRRYGLLTGIFDPTEYFLELWSASAELTNLTV